MFYTTLTRILVLKKVRPPLVGDEDAHLAVVSVPPPPPPAAVLQVEARELTPRESVLWFLRSNSSDLSVLAPILDKEFGDVEGYGIIKSFSTVRVLQFGRDLERRIVSVWSSTTKTKSSSAIMDDSFLINVEQKKLDKEMRETVVDCIKRRPTITDILHPKLNDVTWMTPLLVEMVSPYLVFGIFSVIKCDIPAIHAGHQDFRSGMVHHGKNPVHGHFSCLARHGPLMLGGMGRRVGACSIQACCHGSRGFCGLFRLRHEDLR